MQEIEPPEAHYLNAAIGWLELGNSREAQAEWDRIGPEFREHPEVLEVSWQIQAVEKNWPAALAVASKLLELLPLSPTGWICRSFSLHEMDRTQEAWDNLLPVAERFKGEGTIPYNLACYACRLGQLDEARNWLSRAIKIKPKFKLTARSDPDLKPLREALKKL